MKLNYRFRKEKKNDCMFAGGKGQPTNSEKYNKWKIIPGIREENIHKNIKLHKYAAKGLQQLTRAFNIFEHLQATLMQY